MDDGGRIRDIGQRIKDRGQDTGLRTLDGRIKDNMIHE